MVRVSKTSNYVDAEYVKTNNIESFKIVDEPVFVETKFGEKLQCKVKVDTEEMMWTMNNTSKDTLIDQFGYDTKDWIGKQIPIEVLKVRVGSETKYSINVIE